MKLLFITTLLVLLFNQNAHAQAFNYSFATGTSGVLDAMTGSTQLVGANSDDGASAAFPIGFNFVCAGVTYTQFSANANGILKLGSAMTGLLETYYSNTAANAGTAAPLIMPYWDDLATGTTGKVHYVMTGSSPNRILKVEWIVTVPRNLTGAAGGKFQCWLREGSNTIDFIYGAGIANNTVWNGYTIGVSSSAAVFRTVDVSLQTSSNTAFKIDNTTAITSGRTYTFAPLDCAANLGATSVTVGSLPYSISGQTTCGAGNNITSANVSTIVPGGSSYYTAEDRTYTFTPETTGVHTILLTTTTDDDASIILYQGCPLKTGSTIVAYAQSDDWELLTRTISPSLTSGITYYLVVDNWIAPACITSYSLSITPPCTTPPSALTVSDVTYTSAGLSWTAPPTNPTGGYEWEIRTSGEGGSGPAGLAASGSTAAGVVTASASALSLGTAYTLYVRSNCGGSIFSTWVASAFATLACSAPATATAVSGITTTSVNLSWNASSSNPAGGYQWEVRANGAGGSGPDGLAASGSTAAGVVTVSVSALSPSTTYRFYVRSNCGSAFSTWASLALFTTLCGTITTLPSTEGFEAVLAPCWQSVTVTGVGSWLYYNAIPNEVPVPHSGARFAGIQWLSATSVSELWVSPPYNISANGNKKSRIKIWVYRDVNGQVINRYTVRVHTSPTTGGTILLDIPRNIAQAPAVASTGWYEYTAEVPVSFNASTFYITTQGGGTYGNNNWSLGLDDFRLEFVPSTVSGFTPSNICADGSDVQRTITITGTNFLGTTAVAVNGTAAASFTVDSDTQITAVVSASATSGTISVTGAGGVAASGVGPLAIAQCYCTPTYDYACYNVMIANLQLNTLSNNTGSSCNGTGYEDFTSNPSLTTTLQPGTTYTMTVQGGNYEQGFAAWIDYNNDGVFDEVTEKVGSTRVLYNGEPGTIQFVASCVASVGQHRLRVGTDYYNDGMYITACNSSLNGETEDYLITISAAATCAQPSVPLAVNITTSGAALSWYGGCTANSYEIVVQSPGSGIPGTAGIPTATASYNASDLLTNTTYEYYVRGVCGPGVYSPWAGPFTFTTMPNPQGFGAGVWNVNCYNGSAFETFRGYYTDNALNFQTQSKWGVNNTPSGAPGYSGAGIDIDYHSYSAKRKGFTPGCYVINVPGHDDQTTLYINGVEVFQHLGCCDSHSAVWSGTLDADSEVEIATQEDVGPSYSNYTFTPIGLVGDYYADADGDGYGTGMPVSLCSIDGSTAPAGYSVNNSDCNDNNGAIYQSAALFIDADGDGFAVSAQMVCYGAVIPAGYSFSTNGPDCDDTRDYIHQMFPFYVDIEQDGYGAGSPVYVCAASPTSPPLGYSLNNTDCDDYDDMVHQSAMLYIDADGDGFDAGMQTLCYGNNIPAGYSLSTNGPDCDDINGATYQSATLFIDADHDGYTSGASALVCYGATIPSGYVATTTAIDCNDGIAAIHPNAVEIPFNGIDDNCDGQIDAGILYTTNIQASQCGTTLSTINSFIVAVSKPNVTMHRFEVTNTETGAVQVLERFQNYFSPTMLASYDYATTYSVRVEIQKDGIWLGYYGPSCLVSTPAVLVAGGAATVSPSQCGGIIPTISTLIATTSLANVTGYRFRVTNATDLSAPNQVQIIDRGAFNWFALTMLPTFNYGTTYLVEVSIKTNGVFSAYGSPCAVTAPAVPTLAQCGNTIATKGTLVSVASKDRVTSYRFAVTNMGNGQVTTLDRSQNWFTFNNVPGFVPGGEYGVSVSVMTSGVFSPFSEACLITAPAAARTVEVSKTFDATAYPNPFAENFNINVSTASEENFTVRVYDMTGRLIESKAADLLEMQTIQIGERYPSGVYNVIVMQGENVKTLRVVKR